MFNGRRRNPLRSIALGIGLVTLAAACGNRLPESEIIAKNSVGSGVASDARSVVAESDALDSSDSDASVAAAGLSAGGAAAGPAAQKSVARERGATTGDAPAAKKAPIKVGFIGALSGAAGVTVGSARDGWVIWSKMINARGGINGHPIEVLVGDDGTNDARGVAIAKDFVENKGAVALSWASSDIQALADYAKQRRVPLIGVVEGQEVWGTNPMMFPTSGGNAGGWSSLRVFKAAGITKIAVFYCVEAGTCETGARSMDRFQQEEGVEIVHRAGVSLTQPDFTAECIQARNRGATGVSLLVDQNSSVRFMQSCLRQGYRPVPSGAASDEMAKLPEMDGMVTGGPTFPWYIRSGAPGVDEYVQAFQRYAPNMLTNGSAFQALSWVAAKVFERAVTNATNAKTTGAITSEDILNGLWAIKGDTLDGLAQGGLARTYKKDQPTPGTYCTFVSRLKDGKWSSLTGLTPACR